MRTACDAGSLAYCATQPNIISKDCSTYIDRVARTVAAEKTNTQYSNKVIAPVGSSVVDYLNALETSATKYATNNATQVGSLEFTNIINTFKTADPQTAIPTRIATTLTEQCVDSNCKTYASTGWIVDTCRDIDKKLSTQMGNYSLQQILDQLNTNKLFWSYNNIFENVTKLIISKLSISSLSNPTLMKYREAMQTIKVAIDLLVVSYVLESLQTNLPTDSAGKYLINIVGRPKLYDRTIRDYYLMLQKSSQAQNDSLTLLIAKTDADNKLRCQTVNPTVDSTCVAMRLTNEPQLVEAIDNAMPAYCMNNQLKVLNMDCTNYFNKKIVSDPSFDRVAVYKSVLAAATLPNDKFDVIVLNRYEGIRPWMEKTSADTVVVDSNGQSTIQTGCGDSKDMSIDQCKRMCATYPESCQNDQMQKCKLPKYRYSTTESFKNVSEDRENDIIMLICIILFGIICTGILFKYVCKTVESNSTKVSPTSSFEKDITNIIY